MKNQYFLQVLSPIFHLFFSLSRFCFFRYEEILIGRNSVINPSIKLDHSQFLSLLLLPFLVFVTANGSTLTVVDPFIPFLSYEKLTSKIVFGTPDG